MERPDLQTLYGKASRLFSQGEYVASLALLEEVARAGPDEPNVLSAMARCLLALEQPKRAASLVRRVEKVSPDFPYLADMKRALHQPQAGASQGIANLTVDDLLGPSATPAVLPPRRERESRGRKWLMPSGIAACLAALAGGYLALSGSGASSASYPQTVSASGVSVPTQAPASAAPPKTGEVRTFAGIEMVWIPPGTFMMGAPLRESGPMYAPWETQHQVTLTHGFWMGRHEGTNAQFKAFVAATGYKTDAERAGWAYGERAGVVAEGWTGKVKGMCWRNPAWTVEDRQPVACVSWNDAHAYIEWLNKKSEGTFRLPSEARWEYACRAGTTTPYLWGEHWRQGEGWDNIGDRSWRDRYMPSTTLPESRTYRWNDGYVLVSPAGSFRPNPWGLYDMMGNVCEWCEDRVGQFTSAPVTDPTGPNKPLSGPAVVFEGTRVVRGNSYCGWPYGCRPARRQWRQPDYADSHFGFRVCREE